VLPRALELIQDAQRLYVGDFFPNVRPVSALKTRVWVVQGKLDEALEWTLERGLSVADDLSYLREFEHITLARVLLARRAFPDAMGLLERLLRAADDGARTGSVIEVLVLQAIGYQMQDNISAALVPLERALPLAEPEGYVRIFVDEGPAMATLLQVAAKRRIAPEYARQLLAAFGKGENRTPVTQGLMEPLSERELDVLRLLGTDLDGPDIARQLVVSLSTLRTHTRSIYSKLGVNNRRAAVRRGEELALLSSARS
jgi:LuxR family transcriptional regulator, maltose regulon positive regulatory protein